MEHYTEQTAERPSASEESDRITATESVLGTYELLEKTLLYLPLQDVITVQRVSKDWQAIVKRSQHLQKKCFLVPEGSPIEPLAEYYRHGEYPINVKINPTIKVQQLVHARPGRRDEHWAATQRPRAHVSNELYFDSSSTGFCRVGITLRIPFPKAGKPRPSWLKAQVMNPPATAIELEHGRECYARNPLGVTFEDIIGEWLKLEEQESRDHGYIDAIALVHLAGEVEGSSTEEAQEKCGQGRCRGEIHLECGCFDQIIEDGVD